MKKILLCMGIIILGLLPGCVSRDKAPDLDEGLYPVKAKTFSYLELSSPDLEILPNIAELTETKPESITVDFDVAPLEDVMYGSFRLGNNEQKTWFLMAKDAQGYWTNFYIDRNLDHHLTQGEKLTGFQTDNGIYKGYLTNLTYLLAPVSLQVSYKGISKVFTRRIAFFLEIQDLMKNGARDMFVKAYTATFFEGRIPIRFGKTVRRYSFRLIDKDSNGCFNDYGSDWVYIDQDEDGYFRKDESYRLVEYFDGSGAGNRQKQITVLPYPAKIAVAMENEAIDLTALEPGADQPPAPENQPAAATGKPAPQD